MLQGFLRDLTEVSVEVRKKLCERAYRLFGQTEHARLATISVSHLYILRQSKIYARLRQRYTKNLS